jgi:hypothetical protein
LAKEVIETYIKLAPQVPMVTTDSSSDAGWRPLERS